MADTHFEEHHAPGPAPSFEEELDRLTQRLQREAVLAVELVEASVEALRDCDAVSAQRTRDRDNEIDDEEVKIEAECIQLIALHQPVARDLRRLMIILKVNGDVERIADHATGVAKAVTYLQDEAPPSWPTSLLELAERVIPRCREMLRALAQQDEDAARSLIQSDETLDRLAGRVMDEVDEATSSGALSQRAGLLAYRASRDLERIGDLCGSVAEDIVYLATGQIIRHYKKLGAEAPG